MAPELDDIWIAENQVVETGRLTAEHARWLAERHKDHLSVKPTWVPGQSEITAGQHIGTIVVGDVRIHIAPKVPIDNLFFMLTYAYDLPEFRDQQAPLVESEALFEFIVRIFVKQVDQIVRQGIHRGYIDQDEDHRYLRGRLLLGEHLRRNAVQATRFHQRTNEFTADLLENRILKATLDLLTRVRYKNGTELRQLIRRTQSAFSEVAYASISHADCSQVIYTRLNGRYRSPINLARLLLQHLALESHAGQTPFSTFLLPMYSVFERFIARYLVEAMTGRPRFTVASQEKLWLDMAQSLEGRPDIVLRFDRQPFAVLDTKYKVYGEKPTTDDVFQVFTYAKILGVNRAVLVYPGEGDGQTYMMKDGVALDMRPLSLTGTLDQFEMRCRAFAERLVAELAEAEAIS